MFAAILSAQANEVVVYVAQDQVYAEPILKEFERENGIRVRALYDSEAVKAVGLAQRLLAEKNHPRCDVFWNNEELRTRQLAAKQVFREKDGWVSVGSRGRSLVQNTSPACAGVEPPGSLRQLTNQVWQGKFALAYPLFGSTATHFMVLKEKWGGEAWLRWCEGLQANKPFMVDGNSVVLNLVARGEICLGLTDSDDIRFGQRKNWAVKAVPQFPEMLEIPNTIAIIRNSPNPQNADRLSKHLQSKSVLMRLVAAGALESIETPVAAVSEAEWKAILAGLEETTSQMKKIFLRR